MWLNLLKRETLLMKRQSNSWAMPCLFFTLVMTVMLFALGPFEATLYPFVPRLIIIVTLLALFMQAEQLFKSDWVDGSLTQYYLNNESLMPWLLTRLIVNGLYMLVPLIALSGLAALAAQVPSNVAVALILALSVTLPTLFLITAFAGALTVVLPQAGLLNAIILLPLYTPVLLFAETIVVRAQWGEPYGAFVQLIGAILAVLIMLMPWVIQACLKPVLR